MNTERREEERKEKKGLRIGERKSEDPKSNFNFSKEVKSARNHKEKSLLKGEEEKKKMKSP